MPTTVYPGNAGQSGVTVTLNLVSKYEDRLGNKVDWNGGNDLQAKMANLDYRFSQTVGGDIADQGHVYFPMASLDFSAKIISELS